MELEATPNYKFNMSIQSENVSPSTQKKEKVNPMEDQSTRQKLQQYKNQGKEFKNLKTVIQSYLKENILYSPKNYLQNHKISQEQRQRMLDWLMDLNKQLDFKIYTFIKCINILDRYLEIQEFQQDVNDFHISGIISFYLANKFEEISYLTMQNLHEIISHQKFSINQLQQKQIEIVQFLGLNLSGPSQIDFLYMMIQISKHNVNCEDLLENLAINQLILILYNYEITSEYCLKYQSGAAIYITLEIYQQINVSFKFMKMINLICLMFKIEFKKLKKIVNQIKQFNLKLSQDCKLTELQKVFTNIQQTINQLRQENISEFM